MLVSELASLLSTMPQTHEVAMLIRSDNLYRLVNTVYIANSLSLVILEDSFLQSSYQPAALANNNSTNQTIDKRRKELKN